MEGCVPALSAIFTHTSAPAEMKIGLPISSLDLSKFPLDAGKLGLLLSSLPAGPDFLETLKGGPHVCKGPCLSVLNRFLQSVRVGVGVGGLGGAASASSKTLNLSKNRLRSHSMEALRSAFSEGTLSKLLGLDVSNNPLGPSGVATLARGLSASERALPLQSLKLSKTAAKAEGAKALSVPLKKGKAPSLQVLDLGGNDMRAEGVGGLVGTVGAGTLSSLRVLVLKNNSVAKKSEGGEWNFRGLAALFSHEFPALQELDLSGNEFQGPSGADTAAPMIGEAVEGGRLPSVRTLMLNDTRMREADITAVFSALTEGRAPHVETLRLPKLDTPSSQALPSALDSGHLAQMHEVTLDDRYADGVGVVTRSLVSGRTPSLRILRIKTDDSPEGDSDEVLGALADGLRGGGLRSLADLDLQIVDEVSSERMSEFGRALGAGGASSLKRLSLSWNYVVDGIAGEGCKSLGEVLITRKIPSLRKLELVWDVDSSLEGLAEGLGVGSFSADVLVDLGFRSYDDNDRGLQKVAALICAGKILGLRKIGVEADADPIGENGARALGEALTHSEREAGVILQAFEELDIDEYAFKNARALSCLFRGIAAGAGSLPSLHKLSVTDLVEDEGIGPLAQSLAECITKGKFPKLRNLCFIPYRNESISLGQEGMQALSLALCSPHAKSLRSLTLRSVEQDFVAASPLAECITKGKFPRLRKLHFACDEDVSIRREGMQALSLALCSPHAKSLRGLTLSLEESKEMEDNSKVRAAEAVQMGLLSLAFSCGQLSGLQELKFEGKLCSESLSALSVGLGSGKLRSLRSLELQTVPLGDDEGTSNLCQALSAEKLPELRCLKLGSVSDAGLKKIVKAWGEATPPPLEKLDLSGTAVGDEGVLALIGLAGTGRVPMLGDVRVGRFVSSGTRTVLESFFPHTVESD
uniref:Uncharacterized protein n=1 Tax=Chromera velia CCMP2878 TaxID=1169474 RepID=A0A0G4HA85_9ALVE|eukprot:Cvel_6013.t1-p1 / transcript=Cvel_6013.t1 / gene=Cvel_6013 / organism=Chromera_velia_CCMP2878 / gene_product=hypothetical protein / transcript_product=hypothetical protein / location=Cvel_scaffold288:13390-18375(+) / protein_length=924 / sequence_SO=supercontig / SO=protein_coding / is_pseudo=false